MNKAKPIYFPVRTDTIKKLTSINSFEDQEGSTWFGRTFTMDNGDNFSHWSKSEDILNSFQEGMHIIYQLIQEPKGDGSFKNKVKAIEIVGNLQTQFAPYAMEEIVRSIHNSMRYAVQLAEAGHIQHTGIGAMADRIHAKTKDMLLKETFTNEQNPTTE